MRLVLAVATAALGLAATPAFAADNAMQVCGQRYQAAKKANQLPAGQTWGQYLAACRATLAKAAPTVAAAPALAHATPAHAAPAAAAKPARAPGQQSPAQLAAHDRQKRCGEMWRADKAANKIPAGQTWPKYWSQCNTRLKG